MSNRVFPVFAVGTTNGPGAVNTVRGLTYPVVKRPTWSTLIQRSPDGFEVRLAQMQNPIWNWEMELEYLYDYSIAVGGSYTDFKTLIGFFLSSQGSFDDFLFSDPDDYQVGGGFSGSSYANAQQLPLVSSGGIYYSPLQRNLGGFSEDVTDLQPGGVNDHTQINVWANGNLQVYGVNYTIPTTEGISGAGFAYGGLYIQWTNGYTPTSPIRAAFNFFFRVRFDGDEMDFENFMKQLWAIGGQYGKSGKGALKLVTARPAVQ